MENIPEKSVVVGAGYIGVELAGILNSLGSKTSLVIRYDSVLRNFDEVCVYNMMKDKKTNEIFFGLQHLCSRFNFTFWRN